MAGAARPFLLPYALLKSCMPNLPAQQAQIVPYGRGAKPHFCLLFINPSGEHWPTILQMREHISVREDEGRFLFEFWPCWKDFQYLYTILKLTRTWPDVQYFCAGHPIERDQLMRPMSCLMRKQCQAWPIRTCVRNVNLPSDSWGDLEFMLPCNKLIPGFRFPQGALGFYDLLMGKAEEYGYLFCPLFDPSIMSGPHNLPSLMKPPQTVNFIGGGVCMEFHLGGSKK